MPANPSSAQELSEQNRMAYRHYMECKAVGEFPNDAIVRQNAMIISSVRDEYEKKPLYDVLAMIPMIVGNK